MENDSPVNECIELLKQGLELVRQIDARVFSATTPVSPRGSIGAHLRHIIDTYDCFLNGLPEKCVNYNLRSRDPNLEQDPSSAIEKLKTTIVALGKLVVIDPHVRLFVSSEGRQDFWSRSSVSREVEFLKSHTIHHYSLIAMLLRLHEIDPGEEFGVAPSTLRYRKEEIACAR